MSFSERRRAPRRPYRSQVEVIEGARGTALARDVNHLGMFLNTAAEYRAGDDLKVRFMLPGTDYHVELAGRVVRVAGVDDATDPDDVGVAIEFQDADDWVVAALEGFIREESLDAPISVTKL